MPTARRMGWCHVNALVCTAGHSIRRDAFILTDGAVRCKHRLLGTRSTECGKLLYLVAAGPYRTPEKEPSLLFFAEVTYAELQVIQSLRLGPMDVLRRLGAALTPEGETL